MSVQSLLINNLLMSKLFSTAVIIFSAAAVAVADVLLKKAAEQGSLLGALRSPWLACAVCLYLVQIAFFIVAFNIGWKLSIIGALQTVLYAVIVLAAGVVLFNESLTRVQMMGFALAVGGVVLINWS